MQSRIALTLLATAVHCWLIFKWWASRTFRSFSQLLLLLSLVPPILYQCICFFMLKFWLSIVSPLNCILLNQSVLFVWMYSENCWWFLLLFQIYLFCTTVFCGIGWNEVLQKLTNNRGFQFVVSVASFGNRKLWNFLLLKSHIISFSIQM